MYMSYNIAFFADPHIGYRTKVRSNDKGINIRVQDGYDALKEVIIQIIKSDGKEKIDAVVCGGDLFHYSHPTIRDIATVQHFLRQLAKHNIPFYGLAGNHDANDIRSELAAVAAVNDPDKGIHALYEPYAKYELTDGIILHSVSHHGLGADDAPEVIPVEGAYNLFTTHGAALDPKNQALMRCVDSPREQFIPVEMIIDESFIAKMLGHYHSRYAVGGESLNTWYSGSLVRRGFSDEVGERGWLLVNVNDNGKVTFTPKNISQRPQYDLETIDANDLTATDVMDLLVVNLDRTTEAKKEPIVRQRIINANRGIREGLDRERINELTKHMLTWQLEFFRPEKDKTAEPTKKGEMSLGNKHSINVLESYKGWVKEVAQSVPEEYRDTVVKDAETYIKEARESSFQEGHGH
jgi:DNA repair exonuclease SbcCD nuclease subunit